MRLTVINRAVVFVLAGMLPSSRTRVTFVELLSLFESEVYHTRFHTPRGEGALKSPIIVAFQPEAIFKRTIT